jgi:hypothetical protein
MNSTKWLGMDLDPEVEDYETAMRTPQLSLTSTSSGGTSNSLVRQGLVQTLTV